MLNKHQKEAVEYHKNKPLLIEAGPGSGKTHVIIERVKYLINNLKVDPESLLIITFTIKAAEELKERLGRDIDYETISKMQISTIHSFCYQLLNKNYTIISDNFDEKKKIFIKKNLAKLGFNKQTHMEGSDIARLIEKYEEYGMFKADIEKLVQYIEKNNPVSEEYIELVSQSEYFPRSEVKENYKNDWYNAKYAQIPKSYPIYLKLLEENNYIDFTQIQIKALELLNKNPNTKYRNILVDEFQDSDPIQIKIFEKLLENAESFTAVGDTDQKIYGFRGAIDDYFSYFKDKYSCEIITLDVNYRSTNEIINLSNSLIKHQREEDKLLKTARNLSKPSFYLHSGFGVNEHDQIANLIKYLKNSGKIKSYDEVAILFRSLKSKHNINLLVEKFEDNNISYQIKGVASFLENDAIRAIMLLLHYLIDEDKNFLTSLEIDWLNIKGFCENNHLIFSNKTKTYFDYLENDFRDEVIKKEKELYLKKTGKKSRIQKYSGVFKSRDDDFVAELLNEIEKPEINLNELDATDQLFFKSLDELKKKIASEEPPTLFEVFYEILDIIGFKNLDEESLKSIAILTNSIEIFNRFADDTDIKGLFWHLHSSIRHFGIDQEGEGVQIMTVHKSKGLEFPVVILANLVDKKFPSCFVDPTTRYVRGRANFYTPNEFLKYRNISLDDEEIEYNREEERILYVAITRAQDLLFLSTAEPAPEIIENLISNNPESIKKLDYDLISKTEARKASSRPPVTISFTSLKEYNFCPFKYNLIYNYGFKSESSKEIDEGVLVHDALNKINEKSKENQEINIASFVKENYEDDNLDKIIENLEKYWNDFGKDIEVLETEYEFCLKNKNYELTGAIDLIYKKDGKVGIIDYKNTEAIESNYNYKSQLYTYILALQDNLKIDEIGIYALKSNQLIKIPIIKSELENRLNTINKQANGIYSEEFNKREDDLCENCVFKQVCS